MGAENTAKATFTVRAANESLRSGEEGELGNDWSNPVLGKLPVDTGTAALSSYHFECQTDKAGHTGGALYADACLSSSQTKGSSQGSLRTIAFWEVP